NTYSGVNVDPQTGDYTLSCPTDRMGELDFNISAAHTLTLPQAGSTACLGSNIAFVIRNTISSTAILTVSATVSTFQPEATSSYKVAPGAGLFVYSDATSSTGNYHALVIPAELGGVNIQTTSYTLTSADRNKLVIMNCGSACTATLPGTPPTDKWTTWVVSVGSTLASLSLNSLTYNTGASAPALIRYMPLKINSDGANYWGDVPLVQGAGPKFTPATNGMTIALISTTTP